MVKMRISAAIAIAAVVAVLLFCLMFEVTVDPVFSMPQEVQAPDPRQEALYTACINEIRQRALEEAYAETDNPDVHSTQIRIAESEATVECRKRHPQEFITISVPFELNLFDVRMRR